MSQLGKHELILLFFFVKVRCGGYVSLLLINKHRVFPHAWDGAVATRLRSTAPSAVSALVDPPPSPLTIPSQSVGHERSVIITQGLPSGWQLTGVSFLRPRRGGAQDRRKGIPPAPTPPPPFAIIRHHFSPLRISLFNHWATEFVY